MPLNTRISILLVENDKETLKIFLSLIKAYFPKIVIHTAENPDDAIVKYKDYKHEIVITDIFTPSKDGIKIAQKICEIHPTVAVIFITADTDITWKTFEPVAKRLCLEGIIHKPIDMREVIQNIKEAIVDLGHKETEN
jgi:YesN/AraC family two-component response regulator